MSHANVGNLRAFWETWNTNEAPDMSLLDPEVTYEDTILPDHVGETYRGHEGVARAVARWFEPYAEITILKCRLDRPVWSGSYARAGYLKTLVRRRACILESGATRPSLKSGCPQPLLARPWMAT